MNINNDRGVTVYVTVQLENGGDASAKKRLTQCGRSHKRYTVKNDVWCLGTGYEYH